MGMDLVPRNPNAGGFHANWGGWVTIQILLSLLEQDLTHMDGSNDGHRVPATTAREWGRAVRSAIERNKLVVAETHDTSYVGNRKEWVIPESHRPLFEKTIKRVEEEDPKPGMTLLESYLRMARHFEKKKVGDILLNYRPLDPKKEDWLMEFAVFCERSGGFQQC